MRCNLGGAGTQGRDYAVGFFRKYSDKGRHAFGFFGRSPQWVRFFERPGAARKRCAHPGFFDPACRHIGFVLSFRRRWPACHRTALASFGTVCSTRLLLTVQARKLLNTFELCTIGSVLQNSCARRPVGSFGVVAGQQAKRVGLRRSEAAGSIGFVWHGVRHTVRTGHAGSQVSDFSRVAWNWVRFANQCPAGIRFSGSPAGQDRQP